MLRRKTSHAANQLPRESRIRQSPVARRFDNDRLDLARRGERCAKASPLLISKHCALPRATDWRKSGYVARVVQGLSIKGDIVSDDDLSGKEIYQISVDALERPRSTQYIGREPMHSRRPRRGRRARSDDSIEQSISPGVDKCDLHDFDVRSEAGRLYVNNQPVITLHQVVGPTLRLCHLEDARSSFHRSPFSLHRHHRGAIHLAAESPARGSPDRRATKASARSSISSALDPVCTSQTVRPIPAPGRRRSYVERCRRRVLSRTCRMRGIL